MYVGGAFYLENPNFHITTPNGSPFFSVANGQVSVVPPMSISSPLTAGHVQVNSLEVGNANNPGVVDFNINGTTTFHGGFPSGGATITSNGAFYGSEVRTNSVNALTTSQGSYIGTAPTLPSVSNNYSSVNANFRSHPEFLTLDNGVAETGDIFSNDDIFAGDQLYVGGNAEIEGELTLNGPLNASSYGTINASSITVNGNIDSTSNISGAFGTFDYILTAGESIYAGNSIVTGDIVDWTPALAGGNYEINFPNLFSNGQNAGFNPATTAGMVGALASLYAGDNLYVDDDAYIGDQLTAYGDSAFKGAVRIGTPFGSTNVLSDGDLGISGEIKTDSSILSGTTITAGTDLIASDTISAGSTITATSHITSDSGKIQTGLPYTFSYTSTLPGNGDILSTDDIYADDDIFVGGDIKPKGYVKVGSPTGSANSLGAGDIGVASDVKADERLIADGWIQAGNTSGLPSATNGDVRAGNNVYANGEIGRFYSRTLSAELTQGLPGPGVDVDRSCYTGDFIVACSGYTSSSRDNYSGAWINGNNTTGECRARGRDLNGNGGTLYVQAYCFSPNG